MEEVLKLLDDLIGSLKANNHDLIYQKAPELIQEVNKVWDKADSEEKRTELLHVFDVAHQVLLPLMKDPDLKKRIEEAQSRIYKSFILSECMIGENVSTERLDRITKREIAANRMSTDHSLRHLADMSRAFPHLSENELLSLAEKKTHLPEPDDQDTVGKVVQGISLLKKLRSALRFLGQ